MSTHNICFHGEIRKNINTFGLKKSILSRAMLNIPFFFFFFFFLQKIKKTSLNDSYLPLDLSQ